MSEWKPIKTAPKDRNILAIVSGIVMIVRWRKTKYGECFITNHNFVDFAICDPTLWAPLPWPPKRNSGMSEWQPIETAPKDEAVLVYGPTDIGCWPAVYLAISSFANDWRRINGEDGYTCHPAHWMPLPEPPKE